MWSYLGDPVIGGSPAQQRDAVRFLAQVNLETASPGGQITDEEIAFAIGQAPNLYIAASDIALIASSRPGNVQSKSIDGLSINYGSDQFTHRQMYKDLSEMLRRRGSAYQMPSCGGLSRDEHYQARLDADLPRHFYSGQFDEVHPR